MKSYLIKDTTKEKERAELVKKKAFIYYISWRCFAIRRCHKDCETIYRR